MIKWDGLMVLDTRAITLHTLICKSGWYCSFVTQPKLSSFNLVITNDNEDSTFNKGGGISIYPSQEINKKTMKKLRQYLVTAKVQDNSQNEREGQRQMSEVNWTDVALIFELTWLSERTQQVFAPLSPTLQIDCHSFFPLESDIDQSI
jgi:hypothetical protein